MSLADRLPSSTQERVRRFPNHLVTVSGEGQAVVLRIESLGHVHEETFILDAVQVDADTFAREAVDFYNRTRTGEEPKRRLVETLPIPLEDAGVHVFGRLPVSGDKGELFRCTGCGLTVAGKTALSGGGRGAPSQGLAPYQLSPDFKQRHAFHGSCSFSRSSRRDV